MRVLWPPERAGQEVEALPFSGGLIALTPLRLATGDSIECGGLTMMADREMIVTGVKLRDGDVVEFVYTVVV